MVDVDGMVMYGRSGGTVPLTGFDMLHVDVKFNGY